MTPHCPKINLSEESALDMLSKEAGKWVHNPDLAPCRCEMQWFEDNVARMKTRLVHRLKQ
jgi:hypothetical protein